MPVPQPESRAPLFRPERVREWVSSARQAAEHDAHFWTWPGAGAEHLARALEIELAGSGPEVVLARELSVGAQLDHSEEEPPPLDDRALWIVGGPRPVRWRCPLRTWRPETLLPTVEESRRYLSATGDPAREEPTRADDEIEWLHGWTGGWLAPAEWLWSRRDALRTLGAGSLRRGVLALADDQVEAGELGENLESDLVEMASGVALEPLSVLERQCLLEVAASVGQEAGRDPGLARDWDLDLWRQRWLDSPERLAALESLVRRWGLLAPAALPGQVPVPLFLARLPPTRSPRQGAGLSSTSLSSKCAVSIMASHAWKGIQADRAEPAGEGSAGEGSAGEGSAGEGSAKGELLAERTGARPASKPPAPGAAAEPVLGTSAPEGWIVRLLGPPVVSRIETERTVEVRWRLRRALHCVAFLALAPDRRATKDELVGALWPDGRPDAIRRNFHPTLSEARRCLVAEVDRGESRGSEAVRGQAILFRHGYYLLDPDRVWRIDRDRFLDLLERARLQEERGDEESALRFLLQAWESYRGPLLDGIDAGWIHPLRDQLYRRWREMLGRIGRLARRVGRDPLALDAYRSLLLAEPFEETAHLETMEIYGRQGRRDLVRRQFLRLQEALKELGVEPGAATLDRYHQLMG